MNPAFPVVASAAAPGGLSAGGAGGFLPSPDGCGLTGGSVALPSPRAGLSVRRRCADFCFSSFMAYLAGWERSLWVCGDRLRT